MHRILAMAWLALLCACGNTTQTKVASSCTKYTQWVEKPGFTLARSQSIGEGVAQQIIVKDPVTLRKVMLKLDGGSSSDVSVSLVSLTSIGLNLVYAKTLSSFTANAGDATSDGELWMSLPTPVKLDPASGLAYAVTMIFYNGGVTLRSGPYTAADKKLFTGAYAFAYAVTQQGWFSFGEDQTVEMGIEIETPDCP